jgi:protein TonB
MPRDLFGSVTDPPVHVGTRSKYSVPLSFLAHIAVIVPLVVIPLMATGALPMPDKIDAWVVPPPLPNPPPEIRARKPQPVQQVNPDAAPTVAPDRIEPEKPFEPVAFESDAGSNFIDTGVTAFENVLTPPPVAPEKKPEIVRTGGSIRQPTKIRDVPPIYPPMAQTARVQGVVIIEALIDVDGRVQQARVLRSTPLLDDAALNAVRQWQYTPTLLNGQPVQVLMTVTVMFRLQ